MHPWIFQLTNLTVIGKRIALLTYVPMARFSSQPSLAAIGQNVILFLLGLPARNVALQPYTPLTTLDYIFFVFGFVTLACEFVADNQQYSFQTFKHNGLKLNQQDQWPGARIPWTEEDAKRGFVTKGLWAWSRHPNLLCEQTFWVRKFQIP